MNFYDEEIENAIKEFSFMQFDIKELYKKYNVNIKIPDKHADKSADSSAKQLVERISEESKLKFDLIVDNEGGFSNSRYIRIIENTNHAKSYGKSDDTAESKLSQYINENACRTIVIDLPKGETAKLNALFVCSDDMALKIAINVSDNASLCLFEWYASSAKENSIVSPLHAAKIGNRSDVEIDILHNENAKTSVGALGRITVGEGSVLKMNSIYNGAHATKSTNIATAAGKGSKLYANEIVFGNSEQKFDVGTFLVNASENSTAILRSGAALKENSFCVLKGFAKVEKTAVGSYSNVEERGLVLDPGASVQPLPDMSIDTKNVLFASHSASTSPLDKESLFYLMSRGMDEDRARHVFVASFLSKYLTDISNDVIKEIAISILLNKLNKNEIADIPKISTENIWIVPAANVRGK